MCLWIYSQFKVTSDKKFPNMINIAYDNHAIAFKQTV